MYRSVRAIDARNSQLENDSNAVKTSVRGPGRSADETDPVRFKWGFGEGLLKDKFAFFEAYKNPIPKRRKLLAKRPLI